jgi:hypothetical protein
VHTLAVILIKKRCRQLGLAELKKIIIPQYSRVVIKFLIVAMKRQSELKQYYFPVTKKVQQVDLTDNSVTFTTGVSLISNSLNSGTQSKLIEKSRKSEMLQSHDNSNEEEAEANGVVEEESESCEKKSI